MTNEQLEAVFNQFDAKALKFIVEALEDYKNAFAPERYEQLPTPTEVIQMWGIAKELLTMKQEKQS